MSDLDDWASKGFAAPPKRKVAQESGLLLYRAWGASSGEWGSGYFSLEKPSSVLDAELRFNVADWGNGINFVTTFRLKAGFAYFEGPVAHGTSDLSRPGTQVFIEAPLLPKIDRVGTYEVLRHDVSVSQHAGRA